MVFVPVPPPRLGHVAVAPPMKLYAACRNGNLVLVKAIAGLVPPPERRLGMAWACRCGRLDVVELLVRDGYVDVGQFLQEHARAFEDAGSDGFVHVAQWLLEAGLRPSPSAWRMAFLRACYGGHLATARWVLDHAPVGAVEIHSDLDTAFQVAVKRGHLPVAKWLVSLGHVHIHADDNLAMQKAFYLGSSKMCRWLLGLDPDDAAWPAWIFSQVRFWSPARDAWMRCVTGHRRG